MTARGRSTLENFSGRLRRLTLPVIIGVLAPLVWTGSVEFTFGVQPAAAIQPLVTATFPARLLPEQPAFIGLFRIELRPGTELALAEGDVGAGVGITYVEAGTYAVRADGPMWLAPSEPGKSPATPWIEVAAGADLTLAAGDAVAFPRIGVPRVERSVGEDSATVLTAIITAPLGGVPYQYPPSGSQSPVVSHPLAYVLPPAPLPDVGSLSLAMTRWTVAAENGGHRHRGGGPERLIVETGAIQFAVIAGDHGVTRGVRFTHVNETPLLPGSGEAISVGDYTTISAGAVSETRNLGASPARLLLFSIISDRES
jgi:hypothetical protein